MSENLESKFYSLVIEILTANRFKLTINFNNELGFDFIGHQDASDEFPILLKYYRTERAQPSLISAAAENLVQAAVIAKYKHAVLIVSSVVEPTIKDSLEKRFQIKIIDKLALLSMSLSKPELYDALIAIDDSSTEISQNPDIPDPTDYKVTLDDLKALNLLTEVNIQKKRGEIFSQRLSDLPPGRENAQKYEDLCVEILQYLFDEYLKLWIVQNQTQDALHRFDLICSVSPRNAFWSFVENRLSSRYVVFEFKNYTGEIGQGQVLTTEKYLLPLAFRSLAIILSRKGPNNSAFKTTEGAMRETGKMILILDDDDLYEMLDKKDSGGDPTDVLLDIADEFLTGLSR